MSRLSTAGDREAAIVSVQGCGYYTARAQFTFEADDPLKDGFLLR